MKKLELLKPEDVLTLNLDWATESEKQMIISLNQKDGRQTMNLRLMKTAKLIVLKDPTDQNKIVGWTGFDIEHNPKYPELFSLYLDPKYEEVSDVGLALSHIKYSYLMSLGFKKVYGRVQMDKNNERLAFRVKLGINEIVDPADHQDWVSYCKKCDLYKKTCMEQAYFIINLEKFTRMARIKLGDPVAPYVPGKLSIRLEKSSQQDSILAGKYNVKWAA
jgi:hypothetical protein